LQDTEKVLMVRDTVAVYWGLRGDANSGTDTRTDCGDAKSVHSSHLNKPLK